jgi:putative ABC transport system substrate-binding protein
MLPSLWGAIDSADREICMKRRQFITILGGAAAWPLVARAQQPAMPVIGFLSTASADGSEGRLRAFRQGLGEAGYVEGRNAAIEYRWAYNHYDRFPALVGDLVRRQVTVIAAVDVGAALAAKRATMAIPIVFRLGVDPVEAGLVASLSRPGGNITGVTSLSTELGAKLLELLQQVAPTATDFAALISPTNPNSETLSKDLPTSASTLGLRLHVVHASSERDFDTAFTSMSRLRVGGLLIAPDSLFTNESQKLAALAIRHALPTIHYFREFAAAGGLMSYGNSQADSYRLAGVYTGRVLKGEKPADLPVQQATKVELIINLKTAKALGLTIPLPLLGRADEVIE